MSGTDGSKKVGDPIEVHEDAVLGYIKKGIAGFKTQKEHDSFMKKREKAQTEADAKQAESDAIMNKENIETELNGLYNDVVLKEAELNGVVLDGEQILEMVEELKKRVLPINGNYFDLNSLGGEK